MEMVISQQEKQHQATFQDMVKLHGSDQLPSYLQVTAEGLDPSSKKNPSMSSMTQRPKGSKFQKQKDPLKRKGSKKPSPLKA